MGRMFEGLDTARGRGVHTAELRRATVNAEMVQSGEEPPMTTEVRYAPISIAHNALANAFPQVRRTLSSLGRRRRTAGGFRLEETRLKRRRGARRANGWEAHSLTRRTEQGTTITSLPPVSQPQGEAEMTSSTGIRVMLVEDHPTTMRGLQEILQDEGGIDVVGQAADGEEAVARAEETRPDVIVMDVMMPKKDGVEACRDILELLPATKVLILTASMEDDAVIQAIAAGASGFVQKYQGSQELVDAIRQVASGRLMMPDDAVRRVVRMIRDGNALMPSPRVLTVREREVLTHFARGKSYAGIADSMGIGAVTVRNAIYRVQDKLGVDSKQEIVVWAVRNGLLDGE